MIVEGELDTLLENLSKFLKTKNQNYGNSALEPIKIFSYAQSDPNTLLLARIDDKLSRIKNSPTLRKNDVTDLLGYLLLLMLYKQWINLDDLID